ncbi:MAG TPA: SBBP repeat-containing protein, partial [Terriglobales bacterium]|nr:SBBP repeat-containing protein [Terriglobales bacterium]
MILIMLVVSGGFLLRRDFAHPAGAPVEPTNVAAIFGRLPLGFEPNQGQSDSRVRFLTRGAGYSLFLTENQAELALPPNQREHADPAVVQMQLAGANHDASITGLNQLPGHSNYFIGNNASRWHRNVPQFSRVKYHGIYSGIDLDFYGKQGRLEYDFAVNPGADFRQIELDFTGAQALRVAPNGDLVLALRGRELRFEAPQLYQQSSSARQRIEGKFVLRSKDRVGFEVGEYDRSRTLVIDPVLSFSTYLGGSGAESCTAITNPTLGFVPHCPAIKVDSAQRVYIAGATTDTAAFPAPASGAGKILPLGGASDVFVARINSSGTALDFTSFIGGSGMDYPTGVGVDSGFNVYLAGTTNSSDFPTTAGALQSTATGTHVFVSKLDPTGSANLYSTYLAGSGTDMASALAVDSQGREYVFGTTSSPDFPVTAGALQGTAKATNQFFFSKIDPTANGSNSLAYSTFIGGSSPGTGTVSGGGIAVDSSFNVYLAGGTTFTDMPLLNAFLGTFPTKGSSGNSSVWAARLNAPAANTQQYTPSYETYFGGTGDDVAYDVASDGTNTYVTGSTSSSDITVPTGVSAFQSTFGGATDAFVAKFGVPTTTGTTQGTVPLSYFTYLGGSSTDAGLAIVSDIGTSSGNVRVTGFTDSSNFPAQNDPFQGSSGGGRDAFLARIVTTTTTSSTTTTADTSSASFLGGSATDIGTSIAVDTALNTYVTGETFSPNFPVAAAPGSTPLQSSSGGLSDAFVSKLGPNVTGLLSFVCNPAVPVSGAGCPTPVPSNPTVNPTPVGVGNTITFVYSIYNQGDPVTGAVFTDTVQGTNSTISTATASAGTCTAASGSASAVCNLGTINTSSTTTTTSGSTTTSTTASAATVTVTVTATVPPSTGVVPPKPPDVGNIGTLTLTSASFSPQTASGSATVNDFGVSAVAVSPP